MSTTLRSENLVKVYKKRTVVNKASIQVSKGEIVGLLGPNGAGKTTTFYMITGMIRPESGKVFLDDNEITKIPASGSIIKIATSFLVICFSDSGLDFLHLFNPE